MEIPLYELGVRLDKLYLLRRVTMNRNAVEGDLYMGQLPILDYIMHHPGCTQREVADYLQVTPASIALSTKRLQQAGLIRKEVDQENLRRNKLSMTEKGRASKERFRVLMDSLDRKLFQDFSQEELAALKAFFDRMLDNISEGKHSSFSKQEMFRLEHFAKNEYKEESEC